MALPELIMAIMGTEGGLRHIARADSNLVISRAKVQFRKISCTLQFIEKLLNHVMRYLSAIVAWLSSR